MTGSPLQTEFEFTLPKGYVDSEGTMHRDGVMRLATAADEIKPLNDPRVQENTSYLTIILLSRVVVSLGSLESVNTDVIESLFVSDLAYLQDLYERVNNGGTDFADVTQTPSDAGRDEVAEDTEDADEADASPTVTEGQPLGNSHEG